MQLYMNLLELLPKAQGGMRTPEDAEAITNTLVESIRKRGIREPIIIDHVKNTIKDGKLRVQACSILGIEFVPVVLEICHPGSIQHVR